MFKEVLHLHFPARSRSCMITPCTVSGHKRNHTSLIITTGVSEAILPDEFDARARSSLSLSEWGDAFTNLG